MKIETIKRDLGDFPDIDGIVKCFRNRLSKLMAEDGNIDEVLITYDPFDAPIHVRAFFTTEQLELRFEFDPEDCEATFATVDGNVIEFHDADDYDLEWIKNM